MKVQKNNSSLLIATNNAGKIQEIQAILADLSLDIFLPIDLGLAIDVIEDGTNYAQNASKKALAYSRASGLISLADDSGLEVDKLGGEPGLYSARYSPEPNASDADRRAYLLKKLAGIPRPWRAKFRATVAIAKPSGAVKWVEGICEGEIMPEERGYGGFGYDPIFLVQNQDQTMAELEMKQKNRLSHRGQAVRKAIPILLDFLVENS